MPNCFKNMSWLIVSNAFWRTITIITVSKVRNSESQKFIEDISNVITDIDYVRAIYNCVNSSVTDMANGFIKIYLFDFEHCFV